MQTFIPLIQSLLTIIIPMIGTLLPGILKQDHYQPWVNSLIAGAIVVVASIATAYTQARLGPNFVQDAFIVGALISAMLAGPLKDLDASLQSYVSLFSSVAAQGAVETPVVTRPATIQASSAIPGPDTQHTKAVS